MYTIRPDDKPPHHFFISQILSGILYRAFLLFFLLLLSGNSHAQAYTVQSIPDWVNTDLNFTAPSPPQQHLNSVAYLLVDHQWKIDKQTRDEYQHFVTKARNTEGVDDISQISINFDPSYQSVTLHQISIYRDGKHLDRLSRAQINIIQREKDRDYQIYDGGKTLSILIEDIRPGDTLEYSFSIHGDNPVFLGHFSEYLTLQWSVPLEHAYYRVVWALPRELFSKPYQTSIKPEIIRHQAYTEYIWENHEIKGLTLDANTPDTYDPYAAVYLSDYRDWQEVIDWAKPLFSPVTNTTLIKNQIDSIASKTHTKEQRLFAALYFVQKQIRYLGVELGERSHRPNEPDIVLQQRFGDCKDKSRLLISLLRGLGIEAEAALVNTDSRTWAQQGLPTATAFNHAIVRVRIKGKYYWLDPTRSHQAGNLKSVYQANYGHALLISDQTPELVDMKTDISGTNRKHIEEYYDIHDALKTPAKYQITTNFSRYYADQIRQDIAGSSLEKLQKGYLDYIDKFYPGTQVETPLTIKDDTDFNSFTIKESYLIPEIWTTDDEALLTSDFTPSLIYDHIRQVKGSNRTMPYAVSHPLRLTQATRIRVPDDSEFEDELTQIEDAAFSFERRVVYANNELRIMYTYESHMDQVPLTRIEEYSANIRKVLDLTGYQIQMPGESGLAFDFTVETNKIDWRIASFLLLLILLAIAICYRFISRYNAAPSNRAEHSGASREISGWLLIPGIGLVLGFIFRFTVTLYLIYLLSTHASRAGRSGYSLLEISLLLPPLIFVPLILGYGFSLCILFFKRRHTLPKLITIYYLITPILMISYTAWIRYMTQQPQADTDILDIALSIVYSAIWAPYFLRSRRVKETFIR